MHRRLPGKVRYVFISLNVLLHFLLNYEHGFIICCGHQGPQGCFRLSILICLKCSIFMVFHTLYACSACMHAWRHEALLLLPSRISIHPCTPNPSLHSFPHHFSCSSSSSTRPWSSFNDRSSFIPQKPIHPTLYFLPITSHAHPTYLNHLSTFPSSYPFFSHAHLHNIHSSSPNHLCSS